MIPKMVEVNVAVLVWYLDQTKRRGIMENKRVIVLCFVMILFCACATQYQKVGFTGGYSDYPLGNDQYAVDFEANAFTKHSTVDKYLLYRCAELTIEKGFNYFVVLEYVSTQAVSGGGQAGTMSFPRSRKNIKMFEDKPTGYSQVYDARELKNALAPSIK